MPALKRRCLTVRAFDGLTFGYLSNSILKSLYTILYNQLLPAALSFIFILVFVDPEFITETLGMRQEQTVHAHTHKCGCEENDNKQGVWKLRQGHLLMQQSVHL